MLQVVRISLILSTLFIYGRITYGRISKMGGDSSSARQHNMHMKYVTLHSRRRRQIKLYEDVGYRELIGPRRSKPYCAGRRDSRTGNFLPCCPGRDDTCKIPYYDTACYCDEFCQRSNSSDCCPDHPEFCGVTGLYASYMHATTTEKMTRDRTSTRVFSTTLTTQMTTIAPPVNEDFKVCYDDHGVGYRLGDKIRQNCNKCVCKKASNGFYSFVCDKHPCLVETAMIQVVNRAFTLDAIPVAIEELVTENHSVREVDGGTLIGQYGWTATNYPFFWGLTRGQGVRQRFGTKRVPQVVRNMTAISPSSGTNLPDEFDAREKWQGLIQPPKDQEKCGSSWAFSTTSVASDRLAIQSRGRLILDLSPQHLLSCRRRLKKKKCRKERLDKAWWFLRRRGVVSSECYPLTATHDGKIEPCKYLRQNPKCVSLNATRKPTLYKMQPPYRVASDEVAIMTEIFNNGPVQAVMKVTQDFFLYKRGVYNSLPNEVTGRKSSKQYFHSVKIVGWGGQKGSRLGKYWLVQNSWGTDWGEDGYFRTSRGENANGIERYVLGAGANIKMEV